MKLNKLLSIFLIFGFGIVNAQEISKIYIPENTNLDLKQAIEIAINKSFESTLANTKIDTKKLEIQSAKNFQYPDLKLSGQYLRLTNANVNLKLNSNSNNETPKVNQLMLAQANANVPIFSGYKIKNNIKISENLYDSQVAKTAKIKEEIAMKVVEYYAELYRAQKSVELINENLKSANQRVLDFIDLEKNGIIARNDLLKSQLQQSKVQLSLDEANKNVSVINFYLITLLKLPDDYRIGIDVHQFDNNQAINISNNEEFALKNRKDLEALQFMTKANENGIKIAKSGYYPSLNLVAGYTALNLQKVATVTNALNVGLGFSYNLSSIFKNGNEVQIAKSKTLETKQSEEILKENIKIEVQNTIENYNLALKQNLVYEQAIVQATENFRIVKDKYDNGLSNTNELLEADYEQLNSKINFAFTKANIMLKYYEMIHATGQLVSSFNLYKN